MSTKIANPEALIEQVEKRYPNDALRIDGLKTDKEKTEYVAKLKLIREMKVMIGAKP
jgi:hypothetical protein